MTENRRYTFKLYPTPDQAAVLDQQARMCGQLWNALLEMQETLYRRTRGQRGVVHREGKAFYTRWDLSNAVSEMRRECPEWQSLSTWTPRRVADAVIRAYEGFFRRARQGDGAASGYPRYRPQRMQTWLPHRFASGARLIDDQRHERSHKVWLKGVGEIHARGRLPVDPEKLTDVDIRWRDGAWHASVATAQEPRRRPGREPVEIRFDLIDSFATVDGTDIPIWAIGDGLDFEAWEARIADLQRRMAEEKRGSDDYCRLRTEAARLQAKLARKRKDALHKWTTRIVRRASEIVVVRPPIKEATASGRGNEKSWGANVELKARFNRAILDQAPAMAVDMLAYKAAEAGIPYREAASTELMVGNLAVRNKKQLRRTYRAIKQEKAA